MRQASQVTCEKMVRMGSKDDGGWWMCEDYPLPKDCVVYSIGIANDYSYDVQTSAHFGCEVVALDPTVSHPSTLDRSGKVKFYKLGASGMDDLNGQMPVATLPTLMQRFGHSKINVLKVDCEGCELPLFEHLRTQAPHVLDDVDQLLVEVHVVWLLCCYCEEAHDPWFLYMLCIQ